MDSELHTTLPPTAKQLRQLKRRGLSVFSGICRGDQTGNLQSALFGDLLKNSELPKKSYIPRRKLKMLNNAERVDELRIPPANRLEKLSGIREGQWSIRINDQWRVCFEWCEGNAERAKFAIITKEIEPMRMAA